MQKNKNEMINYINLIFNEIENTIKNINENNKKEQNNFLQDLKELKGKIEKVTKKRLENIEEKNTDIQIQYNNLKDNFNKQMENLNKELKEEEIKTNSNIETLSQNINQLEIKINDEFDNQKKQREDFEENVLSIIEQTCSELSEP